MFPFCIFQTSSAATLAVQAGGRINFQINFSTASQPVAPKKQYTYTNYGQTERLTSIC